MAEPFLANETRLKKCDKLRSMTGELHDDAQAKGWLAALTRNMNSLNIKEVAITPGDQDVTHSGFGCSNNVIMNKVKAGQLLDLVTEHELRADDNTISLLALGQRPSLGGNLLKPCLYLSGTRWRLGTRSHT